MNQQQVDYDLIIIGGGMAGVSLACALVGQNLRIALIEAVAFKSKSQPSYDDRVIALSFGSRRIFETMGIWGSLRPLTTSIKHIHVSDRGHMGITRIHHDEEGVDALGYMVTARDLGGVLVDQMAAHNDIEVISPATVVDVSVDVQTAIITIKPATIKPATVKPVTTKLVTTKQGEQDATLTARLVVAADGEQSVARKLFGSSAREHDYRQTAVIANVTAQRSHENVAYERFTPDGPLALLPMSQGRCSLVWTFPTKTVDEVMAMDDDAFLEKLQSCFGYRLGRLTRIGQRSAYPLHLRIVKQPVQARLALIGNAAHTIHPIAGQGFNLGLRDVAALAQSIVDARRGGRDIGDRPVLQAYADWRAQDQRRVVRFTDGLVRVFSNRIMPLVMARNIGLATMDIIPPLKHLLAQHTMGMAGKLPRLARGIPL